MTFSSFECGKTPASKLASVPGIAEGRLSFFRRSVIPEEYNSIPLFPWRIREIRRSGASKPESIVRIDSNHESLRPFSGSPGESLRKASFYRYFKIDGSKKNLLSLGKGNPLLVGS